MPPPLSRAIGLQLKKCMMERLKEEQVSGDSRVNAVSGGECFDPTLQLTPPPSSPTENIKQEKMELSD